MIPLKKTLAAAALASILAFLPSVAFAWCNDCGGDCCGCPGEAQCLGSYATCEEACGMGGGYSAPARDYAAEAAAQQRYENDVAGNALNDQGNAAWQAGDFAAAIHFYEQSLELKPYDEVIRQNLIRVQDHVEALREKEREKERLRLQKEQENRAMTADIQNVVENFSLPVTPAAGSGDLAFGTGTGTTAPDAFGTRKAAPALEFGNPSEELGEKTRTWFNRVGEKILSKRPGAARRAEIERDPRMVEANRQLGRLKLQGERIDEEIANLRKQESILPEPAQKQAAAEQLALKIQEKKEKSAEISAQEETKKKLHRQIDTEVEEKAKK